MPKIQNIGIYDLVRGKYAVSRPDHTELIRILNGIEELEAYPPATTFLRTHVFVFLDIGDPPVQSAMAAAFHTAECDNYVRAITPEQARSLCGILQDAYLAGHDLVVHCTVGVSRSGAVVEAAVRMGFDDPGTFRAPNARVLRLLHEAEQIRTAHSESPRPHSFSPHWLRRFARSRRG